MHRATSKLLNQSPCKHLPANCTQPHPVHIHDQTIETSLALQTASASCFSQCRELTTAPCGPFGKKASVDATRRERDRDQESCIPAQGEAQFLFWRYVCPFNLFRHTGQKTPLVSDMPCAKAFRVQQRAPPLLQAVARVAAAARPSTAASYVNALFCFAPLPP